MDDCDGLRRLAIRLARISHAPLTDVAHALVRAVSRLFSTPVVGLNAQASARVLGMGESPTDSDENGIGEWAPRSRRHWSS